MVGPLNSLKSHMERRIKGVVFDLDGTLIHSSIDFRKMKQRMVDYLISKGADPQGLSPRDLNVVIINKGRNLLRERGLTEEEIKGIIDHLQEIMNEVEMESVSETRPVEGAEEALRSLREMGYKIAVLTRGHHNYAVETLRRTGLLPYLDLILGRGETPRPKPYPEALEHTAQLLNLKPEELILVGDHPIDSTCAKNAKVHFIGVLTGAATPETWREAGCTEIIEGVWELPQYLKKRSEGRGITP